MAHFEVGADGILDLLRPEVVHFILGFLDARTLGLVAEVCRLLVVLSDETQRRPHLEVRVGALKESIKDLLDRMPSRPQIGFCFSAPRLDNSSLQAALTAFPADMPIIGAMSDSTQAQVGGHLSCTGLGPGGARDSVVMAGTFPEATMHAFHVSHEVVHGMEESQFQDRILTATGLAAHGGSSSDWRVIVLYVSHGSAEYSEKVVDALQCAFPEASIIGGICGPVFLAGSGTTMSRDSQESHSKPLVVDQGLVGVAMAGNVPLKALVSRGVRPLGPVYRVTSRQYLSERLGQLCRSVAVIDDVAATEIPAAAALAQSYQMMDDSGYHMFYIGVRRPDISSGFRLHGIGQHNLCNEGILLDQEGSSATSDLQLRFYQLASDECAADVKTALERAREQFEGSEEQVMGALFFSCNGRGPGPFDSSEQPMVDARAFQAVFPEVPMAGFYAGGEIGPLALAQAEGFVATQTGSATLQGFTCVWGIFTVPKMSARDAVHLPSTVDTSPQSLLSYMRFRPRPKAPGVVPIKVAEPTVTVKDIEGMTARQLLKFLKEHGVPVVGALEKHELRHLAIQTLQGPSNDQADAAAGGGAAAASE